MKRIARIILGSVFIAAIVSVFCVGAVDSTRIDSNNGGIAEPHLFYGYDIGSYGWSSPEVYEWNADVLYSVSRTKRNNERYAGNTADDIISLNGGWVSWHVYCVSDGEEATEYAVLYNMYNKQTKANYYDTYGTKGYKNKLHIKGCYGSLSAGMEITRGAWCPDGDAPLVDFIQYDVAR